MFNQHSMFKPSQFAQLSSGRDGRDVATASRNVLIEQIFVQLHVILIYERFNSVFQRTSVNNDCSQSQRKKIFREKNNIGIY